MKKISVKIDLLLARQEFFIFLGLLFWLAIIAAQQSGIVGWEQYLKSITVLIILQLPVLVFAYRRQYLKVALNKRTYIAVWICCFCIVPAGLMLLYTFLQPAGLITRLLVGAGCGCLVLEMLLNVNSFLGKRIKNNGWAGKIGFEGWVLIIICVFVSVLAAMAVSSMGNPSYESNQRLLIGYEFSLIKVLLDFKDFLFIFFQLLLIYLCGYVLFYINSRFLVAKVFKQQGLMIYFLSALSLIALLYPMLGQLLILLSKGPLLAGTFPDNPFSWENAFAATAIIFLSLPVLLSLQWAKQNSQIAELEKEKTMAELDLLKQQLNPHFFFNTLNNLYALSLRQSPKTPESILGLSELMRYVIYKGQQPTVNLEEEIKYLNDYMQLQMIRLIKKLSFNFEVIKDDGQQKLAPLLLIVFVENAFKHGIEPSEEEAFLHLRLICENKKLYFSCENSFEPPHIPEAAGIGLSNLKRRLLLLYPEKHSLNTSLKNNIFTAVLELDLS